MDQPIRLDTLVRFLLSATLFEGLDAVDHTEIVRIMLVPRLQDGEAAFREGEAGDAWYVTFEGQAEVAKASGAGSGARPVALLEAGACFGKMAMARSLSQRQRALTRQLSGLLDSGDSTASLVRAELGGLVTPSTPQLKQPALSDNARRVPQAPPYPARTRGSVLKCPIRLECPIRVIAGPSCWLAHAGVLEGLMNDLRNPDLTGFCPRRWTRLLLLGGFVLSMAACPSQTSCEGDSCGGDLALSGDAAAGDSGSSADLSTSRDLALRMPPACAANQVLVPGGTFMMGAGDLSPESVPVHEVTVSSFCLDLTEVTVGMYAQCVAAGICKPADTGPTCNATLPDRKQHPINCLGWDYASKYCAWAAGDVAGVVGRLPTEAEWEYAARYDDQRDYPWGNAPPANQACWYGNADVPAHTCATGSYPAGNAKLGLQDMAGNVYEWVFDGYADYAAGPATDPTGPPGAFQAKRVARGGSWDVTTKQRNLRAGARLWFTYYLGYSTLGFRCARANQ